jgi:hypothetical protein
MRTANGTAAGTISFPVLNNNSTEPLGSYQTTPVSAVTEKHKNKIEIHNNGVPASKGFLDNISTLSPKRNCKYNGKTISFSIRPIQFKLGI